MPLISMFYGIIVRMQNEVGIKHNLPHIHCEYAGNEVVVDFDGNVLGGSLSIKQLNILKGWIAIHKDELDGIGNYYQMAKIFLE